MHMAQKFQCPECEYQATQKSHLITHQKYVHMGPKLQCLDCEYQATWKHHLITNQQTVHIGQKFKCRECVHQSCSKSDLVKHQKSVHEGQKYQCPECENQLLGKITLSFIRSLFLWAKNNTVQNVNIRRLKGSLRSHHKSVHMGLKFQCQECEYQATRKVA